jgi:hypothetical protein
MIMAVPIRLTSLGLAAACLLLASVTGAQEPVPATPAVTPPAKPASPADELEPAVDTSAPSASQEAVKPAATQEPAKATQSRQPAQPAAGASARGGRAMDRLNLETTEITGNRELPKVLYIVPWKRSDLGDLVGKPVNSLLDEVLEPVDRDVFRRENRYYRALQADSAETPAAAPPK